MWIAGGEIQKKSAQQQRGVGIQESLPIHDAICCFGIQSTA